MPLKATLDMKDGDCVIDLHTRAGRRQIGQHAHLVVLRRHLRQQLPLVATILAGGLVELLLQVEEGRVPRRG